MELLFPVLIFVGVVALILILFGVGHLYEKKRAEQFEQLARELGLNFDLAGDGSLFNRLQRFPFFGQGRGRRMFNAIWGEAAEVRMAIFDYQYTVGSGKNSHTYKQTMVAFESPRLKLPPFQMRPETFFDRVGSAFGVQDIDFDTHPRFSSMFLLRSEDEPAVRQFFDHALLSHFESLPGICVEGLGECFIIGRPSRRVKADEARSLLDEAYRTYAVLADRSQSFVGESA